MDEVQMAATFKGRYIQTMSFKTLQSFIDADRLVKATKSWDYFNNSCVIKQTATAMQGTS